MAKNCLGFFGEKIMRIQIIGHSGSGKSTLAKEIAEQFSLPIIYLDNVKYYGDFKERSLEEQQKIVQTFLKENNQWVIDGNYKDVCIERFSLAEIIIYLDYPRFYCYSMCKNRAKKGIKRESFPCLDRFNWEFKKWILFKGRTRKRKKMLKGLFYLCKGKHFYYKNRKELEKDRERLLKTIAGLQKDE